MHNENELFRFSSHTMVVAPTLRLIGRASVDQPYRLTYVALVGPTVESQLDVETKQSNESNLFSSLTRRKAKLDTGRCFFFARFLLS
jgi:hypothetical protein